MGQGVSAGVAERAIREGQVAMPADRLFHARLGHSAKVARLSDLGFRVWTTYVLGADDFGVMRADAVAFQAAHDALRTRPAAEVTSSIAQLVEVGLVAPFAHQGAKYLYQADWQDFQRVRFPTRTLHPLPAEARVSARTRHLWSAHPGGVRLPSAPREAAAASAPLQPFSRRGSALRQEHVRTPAEAPLHQPSRSEPESVAVPQRPDSRFHTPSDGVRHHVRTPADGVRSHARAYDTAHGVRRQADEAEGGTGGDVAARATAFVERYRAEWYPRHRGVAYAPTRAVEASDADAAERLCATWDDAVLTQLVERFLTTEGDRFLEGRTRTLSMLLSRAPALAEQLRRPADGRTGAARSTEQREAYDAVIERATS